MSNKFILMCIVEDEEGKRLYQSTLEPKFMQDLKTGLEIICFEYDKTIELIERPVAYLE